LWAGGRLIWLAGFALIAVGVVCLYLSDQVVREWWQGTLDAFGVGSIIAGVVDVLVISRLTSVVEREQRIREAIGQARLLLKRRATLENATDIVALLEKSGDLIPVDLLGKLKDHVGEVPLEGEDRIHIPDKVERRLFVHSMWEFGRNFEPQGFFKRWESTAVTRIRMASRALARAAKRRRKETPGLVSAEPDEDSSSEDFPGGHIF
jgi:hypothetical protein